MRAYNKAILWAHRAVDAFESLKVGSELAAHREGQVGYGFTRLVEWARKSYFK